MVKLARILSKDFPFVRVDFYDIEDKVYVGELTFMPMGGFGNWNTREWDYKLGEYLDLSKLPEDMVDIIPELR